MVAAPQLPTQVSADGREVWDWAHAFSEHVHRLDKMATLRAQIASAGAHCGNCHFWMKSRECPRERNVGGMSRGPSGDDRRCDQFQITTSAARLRDERSAELAFLASPNHTNPEAEHG